MEKVILCPDGADRREVPAGEVEIPDLWHLHIWLREQAEKNKNLTGAEDYRMKVWSDMVLETWHLAHDLKKNCIKDGKL